MNNQGDVSDSGRFFMGYRMSCHGSTQVTPYQLVYGHDAVLRWETNITSRRVQLQDQLESDQYRDLMMDELEDVVQHRPYALQKIQENKV